jgi:hypothetical protein
MTKQYFKGDKVWIYDSPCSPRLATIFQKMTGLDAYSVDFKDGRESIRTYTGHCIFAYPEGLNEMVCKMKDDAFSLDKAAKEFEESPELWMQ